MKDPPKTLPFFYYGYATKNVINQIAQILHRSTSQPCLQILTLPPLLPQTQSENIQLQNTPIIPVPSPGVEPVSQPTRMQTLQSPPTPHIIMQTSTSPSLNQNSNPWIKFLQNI